VTGDEERTTAHGAHGVLSSKLQPTAVRQPRVPARLRDLLAPRFGALTLVHAGPGYGKTVTLAASHRPEWTWYNLDATDRESVTFARRLSAALGIELADIEDATSGEMLALDLAHALQGSETVVTLDRCEQVGDAVELGRFLGELLVAAPHLALRVATRTRPPLPLERMRLEGRLYEVGPEELRLTRDEIAELLTANGGRPPRTAELDFADTVLAGWPAAVLLWQSGIDEDGDLTAPLQAGQPLHEYIHEEIFGRLPDDVMELVKRDWRWLLGRGPLLKRATNSVRRQVADRFVRDRVGVVPSRHGWRLHPLVAAFASTHTARGSVAVAAHQAREEEAEAPGPAAPAVPGQSRLAIGTFGGLRVLVDGAPVADAAWPAAARRLLELLLCCQGGRTTANEAAHALWPQHPARAARNSFNVALHGLRRALEPELLDGARSRYVVREGPLYRLAAERLSCDAEDFVRLVRQAPSPLDEARARRLQAAIDLHAGDFLAGCEEEFAGERRAELRALLVASLEELGQWYAAVGRADLAVPALRRLVAMEPGRRDAWARLLELHEAETQTAGDDRVAFSV
jgi:DNA-binding SARP family transcriptional activator